MSAAYAVSTPFYAYWHGLHYQRVMLVAAFFSGLAVLMAIRLLQPRLPPRLIYLPYLLWLVLAIVTVPLYSRQNDNVSCLNCFGKDLSPARAGNARFPMLVDINSEARTCMALPLGKEISMEVTVPESSWFTFGVGVSRSRGSGNSVLIKLILQGSDARPVAADSITLPRPRSGWTDRTVDLAAWAGKKVRLTVQAAGPASSAPPDHDGDEVYISTPRFISRPPVGSRRNVILVVIDTTRFDHISHDPSRPGLSPHLARLAAHGAFFERHYAQSSWTLPSMASIITSKMPIQTGVVSEYRHMLEPGLQTLAEIISSHGLRTAGFSANELVRADNGFNRGFDSFHQVHSPLLYLYCMNIGEEVNRRVLGWLDTHGESPFFMWLIYIDPHDPYLPPVSYINRPPARELPWLGLGRALATWGPIPGLKTLPKFEYVDYYHSLHQGEIQYVDHCIGDLMEALKEKGLLDQTLVVVTADHGEEFLDHGLFGHGNSLYEELIRVPLIIYDGAKPQPGRVVSEVTQNLDLVPTILEYLGMEAPAGALGSSILPLLYGERPETTAGVAVSELPKIENYDDRFIPHRTGLKDFYQRALITDRYKLIEQTDLKSQGVKFEFYDLEADPAEQHPSRAANREPMNALRERLEGFFDQLPGKMDMNETVVPDPEMLRRMKALGYIK
ncbi:MAG TPA: sulfatase [bacterium]|nr:sulfatase [bacterium]